MQGDEYLLHKVGHGVRGKACPFHGLGFLGLKDTAQQGPVDGPRLDGFAFVGAVAVDALLADVNLPASKIGGCGFHRFGV